MVRIRVGSGLRARRRALTLPITMPTGADFLLYASDVAAGSNIVRNRAVATPVALNLFGQPRPGINPYGNTGLANAMTRTFNVAGTDAQLFATQIAYTAGGSAFADVHQSVRLPAGTYTHVCDIKSNGAAGAVRIGNQAASLSADKAVGITFAQITHTFTLATEGLFTLSICPPVAGTAFDVTVDNIGLFVGDVPLALTGNERHIQTNRKPNMNGGVIESSATLDARMSYNFADAESLQTAMSAVCAVRWDPAIVSAGSLVHFLVNERETANELNSNAGFAFGVSGALAAIFGATGGLPNRGVGPVRAGWCVFAASAGPTGTTLYLNGFPLQKLTPAYGATLRTIDLMARGNNLGNAVPGKVAFMGVWRAQLTDAQIVAATELARREIDMAGEVYVNNGTLRLCEGDSITASTGDATFGGFVARSSYKHATRLQTLGFAVPGSIIGDGTGSPDIANPARIALVNAKLDEALAAGKRVIVSVLIGANNFGAGDPALAYTRVKNYLAAFKSRGPGVRTTLATMTAINGLDGTATPTANPNQANINAFNAAIRAGFTAGDFDALVDFDATVMGVWDTANFGTDKVHPNGAGHEIMAVTDQAATAALVI